MESLSNNSTGNPASANAYRQSYSGPSSAVGTPTLADRFSNSIQRSSLDELERYKAPTFQSSSTYAATNGQSPLSSLNGSTTILDASIPTVPAKSARRAGVNGATTAASSVTATATALVKTARRTSFNNSNLPPGQKPELLPKPTRFRMKDGTGTLVTGEEEAFKRKFPSADLDEDLMQFQTPVVSTAPISPTPLSPSSSSFSGPYSKENLTGNSVTGGYAYGRESPVPSSTTQYKPPSQRVRDVQQQQQQHQQQQRQQQDYDDEEEDEPLVRSRRRHHTPPTGPATGLAGAAAEQATGKSEIEGEEAAEGTPMESVRERVLRMNRVGRVV